jgi:hypothetical protein
MKIAACFTAAIIAFSGASLGQPNGLTPTSNSVSGPVTEGFQLSIVLSNTVVQLNEKVFATISLRNASTNIGRFPFYDAYANYRFDLRDAHGQKVAPTEIGQKLLNARAEFHTGSQRLQPGQTYEMPASLSEMFHMTNAGDYTVSVSREVRKRGDTQETVWVSAGPLRFTITESEDGNAPGGTPTTPPPDGAMQGK